MTNSKQSKGKTLEFIADDSFENGEYNYVVFFYHKSEI